MKFNLGCGNNIKKGYINLDKRQLDLNKYPYPIDDESADEIYLSHVLEHLEDMYKCIEECYRILKKDGKLIIKVPTINRSIAHKRESFDYSSFWCMDINNRLSNLQEKRLFKIKIKGKRRSLKYWFWRKFIDFMKFFYTEYEYILEKVN